MTKIRIVAAVVDTKRLTLYKENGETIRLPQGDPRIQGIIDQATVPLSRGEVVEITLDQQVTTTAYNDFEKKSKGMVRFFKVAKTKLAGLFGGAANDQAQTAEPVAPVELGNVHAAVAEIMAHAQPATNDALEEEETVVAVVDNQPIPGAENLLKQFAHANSTGSTKGMEAFMARISKVIAQRRHSIDDLLKFMQKGDLPVADDGSIIIYKILKRYRDGGYVDCHSKRVHQNVGSYVKMDPKMVDHDRRRECSHGLHVARRGYLSSFSGDVCVLAKVAPEDVIAVPEKDANKMRVCGYHILFELTDEMFRTLKSNKPMTSIPEGKALLAKAIAGDHQPPVEDVIIGGEMGTNTMITPLAVAKPAPVVSTPLPEVEAIDIEDPSKITAPPVDPKAVAKTVTATKTRTQKEHIQHLIGFIDDQTQTVAARMVAADDLIATRARAKKSWNALGYPNLTDDFLVSRAKYVDPSVKAPKPKAPKLPKGHQPELTKRQNQLRVLYNNGRWAQLAKMKTKAKKSWEKLGFTPAEIATIKENL